MQKQPAPRNAKYLAYIRTKPCAVCGGHETCAAHLRKGAHAGMSQKPSDYRTTPLCNVCHHKQHSIGEETFWKKIARQDPEQLIISLMFEYARDKRIAMAALEEIIEAERSAPI